jgi:DNA-binding MarR family transcriptional regulator
MWQLVDAVRANQRATDIVDEIASQLLGVNRTDARCLDILEQHGRISAGELATESNLSTGAITAVVDRLERAGYVHRTADPSDRRRVLVELTQEAQDAAAEMFGPLAALTAPLLAQYSEEELRLLIEFHRLGRDVQERHAEFLRERLRSRSEGQPGSPRSVRGRGGKHGGRATEP